jgi:hypothetical protein
MTIPESVRTLVATGPLAHLTTLNSDGSPQVTVVWVAIEALQQLRSRLTGQGLASRCLRLCSNISPGTRLDRPQERDGHIPRRRHRRTLRFAGKIFDPEPVDALIDKLTPRKPRVVRQESHREFCRNQSLTAYSRRSDVNLLPILPPHRLLRNCTKPCNHNRAMS